MTQATTTDRAIQAALIWLDDAHAVVARSRDGGSVVTAVDRALDGEDAYLIRVVRETAECDRLIVTGSDDARVAFEREYVAVYRRPDRLIDQGPELEPAPHELASRLRLLLPLSGAPR
jgi:hypothetical protein